MSPYPYFLTSRIFGVLLTGSEDGYPRNDKAVSEGTKRYSAFQVRGLTTTRDHT